MGILDMFKKKKEEDFNPMPPDFMANQPDNFNTPNFSQQQGFGQQPNMNQDPMSQQFPPPFAAQTQPPQQYSQDNYENMPRGSSAGYPPQREMQMRESNNNLSEINMGKDFEIINAKLDAIKAELDSINQRVKRIERMSEGPGEKKDNWY